MASTSTRSVFHEAPSTVTPGVFWQKAFCWTCSEEKKAKGGTRKGPLRRFTCSDCLASKVDANRAKNG